MSERKKILLIGSIPPPYHGSSMYFSNLLNSKIKEEFDITHLDISDHRNLNNLSKLDLTNVKLALENIFSLYRFLKKHKPDLVYIPVASNFLPYLRDGLFILTSSYFSKAKIAIHLHEGDYFRKEFYSRSNLFVKYFIKKSLSKADTAIVLGESLRSVFKGLVKNVVACPSGINIKTQLARTENSDDKIKVGFLGNLFESKGVLDLLNASDIVLKKYGNVEFQFAGGWSLKEGNTKEKAENIIREKKLDGKIKFSGFISENEKQIFLNQTDIFVFPTWYKHEGFPAVIIEAMSASCPVISSKDTGAISDIVLDGVTGILIEKKNIEKIAEAVITLIENPGLRKAMGQKGKDRYMKFYTLDINIDSMISIFNKMLN